MLILSATALYFLGEDKTSVEKEAREQGAAIAAQAARFLGGRLARALTNGPARHGVIYEGRIQSPADSLAPPEPPRWMEQVPANKAGAASGPPAANAELERLALEGPSLGAEETARHYVDLARRYPGVTTATGASLEAVALLAAVRTSAGRRLPPEFLDVLERHARETPSFLTGQLLEETGRAAGGAPSRERVQAIRAAWADRQLTVVALHEVLGLGTPAGEPIEVWLNVRGQQLLALGDPIGSGWKIALFSDAAGQFRGAFAASQTVLPAYAGVRIRLAGESIPLSLPAKPKPRLLASARGVLRLPFPRSFTVEVEADPSALYARYRQRLWVIGGLILSTAAIAFLGLFILWQGYQRQQRLSEMRTEFVSAVSHELRAPIGAVQLMAESLERGTITEPERQKAYFRLIAEECRRLGALAGNVLDFSRMESGRRQYTFAALRLTPLLHHAAAVMEPLGAERGVRVEVAEPDREMEPNWDGAAVEQALLNLLDNAIKHSPEGATVRVETEPMDSAVRLWVVDSGPGIAPEEQSRIFDLFYRVGSELRRETKGVGIGLAIVKHIAEAHGGRVLVESTPGAGSRFALELPL